MSSHNLHHFFCLHIEFVWIWVLLKNTLQMRIANCIVLAKWGKTVLHANVLWGHGALTVHLLRLCWKDMLWLMIFSRLILEQLTLILRVWDALMNASQHSTTKFKYSECVHECVSHLVLNLTFIQTLSVLGQYLLM